MRSPNQPCQHHLNAARGVGKIKIGLVSRLVAQVELFDRLSKVLLLSALHLFSWLGSDIGVSE